MTILRNGLTWLRNWTSKKMENIRNGGTFLYRRKNGVFNATLRWYYCYDIKWCFICDIMFLLFQYLRSYFPFSPSFSISCFCCFNTYTDISNFHQNIQLPNDSLISCGNIFQYRLLSSNFKYSSVIIENEKLQRVNKLKTFHFQP